MLKRWQRRAVERAIRYDTYQMVDNLLHEWADHGRVEDLEHAIETLRRVQ